MERRYLDVDVPPSVKPPSWTMVGGRRVSKRDQAGAAGGRTGPLVNGGLIALGALAIVDNVVAHWLLGLHRAVPGPNATAVEIGLIVLGVVLLLVGLWRERRARRAALS